MNGLVSAAVAIPLAMGYGMFAFVSLGDKYFAYGALAGNDPLVRREITRLGARLLAHDLRELGITVDCVPVLDVPVPGAHDIIGDRAYGSAWQQIAALGRAVAPLAGGRGGRSD